MPVLGGFNNIILLLCQGIGWKEGTVHSNKFGWTYYRFGRACQTSSRSHEISSQVDRCSTNILELNVSKTKELVVDFRKRHEDHLHLAINNTQAQRVDSHKFLGIIILSTLRWKDSTSTTFKKAHQTLFFLKQLKKCGVSSMGGDRPHFCVSCLDSVFIMHPCTLPHKCCCVSCFIPFLFNSAAVFILFLISLIYVFVCILFYLWNVFGVSVSLCVELTETNSNQPCQNSNRS